MIIGSISENKDLEKRVSITPEIAKKYINLGFEINLSENYGKHLGFEEKEYNPWDSDLGDYKEAGRHEKPSYEKIKQNWVNKRKFNG